MTDPTIEPAESLGTKFKKALSAQTIILAMLVLGVVGDKIWGYVEIGAQAEFKTEVAENFTAKKGTPFYNAVDSVFTIKIKDPDVIEMLLESEEIEEAKIEAAAEIRAAIIEDVMKKDTHKISMRSFIGMKIKMRDEEVLPALANLLDAWDKGELMTKRQADAYVTRKIKSMVDKGSLKETPSF